jgi:hypothetical protein
MWGSSDGHYNWKNTDSKNFDVSSEGPLSGNVIWNDGIQQFASKHKPQTFSRVCLRLKRDVYRWKRNVSLLMWRVTVQSLIQLFFRFWCAFVYVSVFPSSQYCKSDQTCLYSYFLWLERIIMGLEILKRARRHIKTWQLRQK